MRIIGLGNSALNVETAAKKKAIKEQSSGGPNPLKEMPAKQEQRAPSGDSPRKAAGVSSGFMKSTAASESRDISSPIRTASEDSTTSTEREIALEKLRASLGRFVRSGYVVKVWPLIY